MQLQTLNLVNQLCIVEGMINSDKKNSWAKLNQTGGETRSNQDNTTQRNTKWTLRKLFMQNKPTQKLIL